MLFYTIEQDSSISRCHVDEYLNVFNPFTTLKPVYNSSWAYATQSIDFNLYSNFVKFVGSI